jgi:hypothetical protein
MFQSRKPKKKFCSLECLRRSDYQNEMLRLEQTGQPTDQLKAGRKILRNMCLNNCGRPTKRLHKKFCGERCYREYLAERFDRWIASPGTFEELANYDEFLTQEELPCLLEGCGWTGQGLCWHMNFVHGVPAVEFKKLAGFNAQSSVMGKALQDQFKTSLARRMKIWANRGYLPGFNDPEEFKAALAKGRKRKAATAKGQPPEERRETLEHRAKAKILMLATHGSERTCRNCKGRFVQPHLVGRSAYYCSDGCKADYIRWQQQSPAYKRRACEYQAARRKKQKASTFPRNAARGESGRRKQIWSV